MRNHLQFKPDDGNWAHVLKELVRSDIQIAMVLTGGGSEVITRCLGRSGASLNFVEAVVPYSRLATQHYLGGKPEAGYATRSTATKLAQIAYTRATKFSEKQGNSFGIALTAALPTTSGVLETGTLQECCVHVASRSSEGLRSWSLSFQGHGDERSTAEQIANQMFLIALQDSLQKTGLDLALGLERPLQNAALSLTSEDHGIDSDN